MNEYQTFSIIESYNLLEERFLEFTKYVLVINRNLKIESLYLASIFLETCSIIDSIFRYLFPKAELKKINKKRSNLRIGDFRKQYAKLNLHILKTLVYVVPPRYLMPFKEWGDANKKNLEWWHDYNELKHNRIKKIKLATLENTLYALCGLYQIILILPEFKKSILRAGWLKCGNWNPEFVLKTLNMESKETFLVESKLFVTPIGKCSFPADIKNIRPIHFNGADRLIKFLGKM